MPRIFHFAAMALILPAAGSWDAKVRPVQHARPQVEEVRVESADAKSSEVIGILPAPDEAVTVPSGKRIRVSLLKRDCLILALIPLVDVELARIRAALPDGRVLLVANIEQFRKAENRTLVNRRPVKLPRGTRIISEPRVPFDLLVEYTGRR